MSTDEATFQKIANALSTLFYGSGGFVELGSARRNASRGDGVEYRGDALADAKRDDESAQKQLVSISARFRCPYSTLPVPFLKGPRGRRHPHHADPADGRDPGPRTPARRRAACGTCRLRAWARMVAPIYARRRGGTPSPHVRGANAPRNGTDTKIGEPGDAHDGPGREGERARLLLTLGGGFRSEIKGIRRQVREPVSFRLQLACCVVVCACRLPRLSRCCSKFLAGDVGGEKGSRLQGPESGRCGVYLCAGPACLAVALKKEGGGTRKLSGKGGERALCIGGALAEPSRGLSTGERRRSMKAVMTVGLNDGLAPGSAATTVGKIARERQRSDKPGQRGFCKRGRVREGERASLLAGASVVIYDYPTRGSGHTG